MSKIAIIGASYLQRPLVEKAKEMGLRTICFAWPEGAVCKDICDTFYPVSITEKDEILRLCREEQIDGICTIASDVAAPTVAYVAEQMGLTGNSYEASLRAHDKYAMRVALSEAGVECPKFTCVNGISGLEVSGLEVSGLEVSGLGDGNGKWQIGNDKWQMGLAAHSQTDGQERQSGGDESGEERRTAAGRKKSIRSIDGA